MTVTSSVRVGFVTGRQIVEDGGTLYADAGLARVVDLLHERFPRLEVAACVPPTRSPAHDEAMKLSPSVLHAMPAMSSFAAGSLRTLDVWRVVHRLEDHSDVLLVQLPMQAPFGLSRPRRPRVYHVFGDVLAMATTSDRYAGPRRVVALTAAHAIERRQRRLIGGRDARVVTNGDAMLERYRRGGTNGRSVVSSALGSDDVDSVRRRRPDAAPVRVLFVGYFRAEKALDTLFDAFVRIREARPDAELRLVGRGEIDGLGEDVQRAFDRAQRLGGVSVVGDRPFGPELFAEYADADVLVLPSRSEGTPRVLVEARAFRCPVVATTVGGIPTSVTSGVDGLLVPPDSPARVADAVLDLADDSDLRARLVENGLARARACTVDAFVDTLGDELEAALGPDELRRSRPVLP